METGRMPEGKRPGHKYLRVLSHRWKIEKEPMLNWPVYNFSFFPEGGGDVCTQAIMNVIAENRTGSGQINIYIYI